MKITSLLPAMGMLMAGIFQACSPTEKKNNLTPSQTQELAREVYTFGYPLVTMQFTQDIITNVASPSQSNAPVNQFAKQTSGYLASNHSVTAPNNDTHYTTAFLDLTTEPQVFSYPDFGKRYFLFPMLNAWTDVFFVSGTRTTGEGAKTFAIVGPNWNGKLPAGMERIDAPTNQVWILGRLYTDNTPQDLANLAKLQAQVDIRPLSAYGNANYKMPEGTINPNIDMKTPTREQVNNLSAVDFFNEMAKCMATNPIKKEDSLMLDKMNSLGLMAGKSFDVSKADTAMINALERGKIEALKLMEMAIPSFVKPVNGWGMLPANVGYYGTDYLLRAITTLIGLGANLQADATYPIFLAPLDGNNEYVIHFKKGELPPVNGFWSLTLYNEEFFFYPNNLNRFEVSSRTKFKENKDGSIDIYIQHNSPNKEKESNWLPAPKGAFKLMFRFYYPKPAILNGTWTPPTVTQVK